MYAYLLRCENRKTYSCYPSYKTIAGSLNICQNTVRKYFAGLEEKHLIETAPTSVTLKSGGKRNGNLLYNIRPISEALAYHNDRQIKNARLEFARAKLLERQNMPQKRSF